MEFNRRRVVSYVSWRENRWENLMLRISVPRKRARFECRCCPQCQSVSSRSSGSSSARQIRSRIPEMFENAPKRLVKSAYFEIKLGVLETEIHLKCAKIQTDKPLRTKIRVLEENIRFPAVVLEKTLLTITPQTFWILPSFGFFNFGEIHTKRIL